MDGVDEGGDEVEGEHCKRTGRMKAEGSFNFIPFNIFSTSLKRGCFKASLALIRYLF
jgi:hypothetical protein